MTVAAAPTRREEQKRRTRLRLVKAASEEFSKKGLMATTTADVAKSAGVSHGTVFVHFPTREKLVAEVIQDFGEKVIRRMHDLVREGMGVREVLKAHLKGLEEHEALYTRLVLEAPLLPREARNTLLGIQSAISLALSEAAQREIEAGKIRPVPMHLLFNTWVGLVHHYLVNHDLFAPGESVIARRGEELLDHYMTLLTSEKGGAR